ncbi:hypothetical protein A5656_27400 [Mycobacterium gordonae]|jgi:hypothetical protein|uniref:hypothetical protein n=1 Tax=Mycobacterium paragordonae TaxID=1389713 RepID=UPI0007EFDF2C|nr:MULTISPECIES: hypothetical protein [Mycobacterium]OBK50181.1 hypothetical protein A5656_27400 [Mycobacterium gordonae]
MTNSSSDVTAAERFYAASGPMATSVMECDSHYYAECLMSGRGAVAVWLSSGDVEHIAGTRYLDAERLRADENEGALEIIYLGEVLRSYPAGAWTRWECADSASS